MKRPFLLLGAVFLLAACSSLPKVLPVKGAPGRGESCAGPFPQGKWQFAHSIEATMKGRSAFLTGVAVTSSADRTLRCAIMTIEGLSVFEAEWGPNLTVHRAIAPFDSKPFAEGLIRDMQLLFFHPRGSLVESGMLKGGSSICRYREADGEIVDVVSKGKGGWELRRYASDHSLLRTARMSPAAGPKHPNLPGKIELTAHGPEGYKLVMTLLEAVRIKE